MREPMLVKRRLHGGVWEGLLTLPEDSPAVPQVEVVHLDTPLEGVTLTEAGENARSWLLRVPIPAQALCDGVQTFVIRDSGHGTVLGSFTIVSGEPLEDDIRAEVSLLRAELDMLKKAFRRHLIHKLDWFIIQHQ